MAADRPPNYEELHYEVTRTSECMNTSSAYHGRNQTGGTEPVPPPGDGQHMYLLLNQQRGPVAVTTGSGIEAAPLREAGPPPKTTIGLVMSILATLFCCLPCGIGAICANLTARIYVKAGRYTDARASLYTMWCWISVSIASVVMVLINFFFFRMGPPFWGY